MTTQSLPSTPRDMAAAPTLDGRYEHAETRELVALVNDAAELVRASGEAAFGDLRVPDSRWRQGERYVFVLDPDGTMLVHPDPALEGTRQLALKDLDGRPIIGGLIAAATTLPDKPEGWYHYLWPVPGGLLPRWKSSFVQLVTAPSGKRYVVGSGMYDDRMERAFVVDLVTNAVGQIETQGAAAFGLLRDPTGPFLVKDAYLFVSDMDGVGLVNPAFPNLEGRTLLDMTDAHGKHQHREMLEVVRTRGAGWVDYLWPRPGESVATQKSTYVSRATLGETPLMVGCGVYLADAPKEAPAPGRTTARALMALVREAAAVLEERGEQAYPEFRKQGSKWLHDDTYLWVVTTSGAMPLNAAEPELEGMDTTERRDVVGRPFGRMIQEVGAGPSGEGWVHYMYPRPGALFPTWKSTFVKRVTFPSGAPHIVGCGIYDMQMDRAFIEDVVGRAAALVAERGSAAFGQLRDRTGPFVFMDTYVFVQSIDGTELVNPAQPGLEGRNLIDHEDLNGKPVVREEIEAAIRNGSAWVDCYWYRPGDNVPARKATYVRKVQSGPDTYIVGSGIYVA